jgi:hypothetical protein
MSRLRNELGHEDFICVYDGRGIPALCSQYRATCIAFIVSAGTGIIGFLDL